MIRDATAHSPEAAGLTKDLVGRAFETPMDEELEREAAAQSELVRRIGTIL
jgi:hypothetical protein